MKMNNKIIIKALTLAIATVLAVIAGGCYSGPKTPGQQTPDRSAGPHSPETNAPVPADTVTEDPLPTAYIDRNLPDDLDISGELRFMYCDMGLPSGMSDAVKAVAEAFEKKYPNTRISYENVSSALLKSRIASGDISDVFWCEPDDIYTFRNKLDVLLPLDGYVSAYNIDPENVYPGALEAGKSGGSLYMVPLYAHEMVLVYNKTMLSKAGIEWDGSKASSWEEFKNACKKLTVFDNNGKVQQSGIGIPLLNDAALQMFLDGFGGTWIDQENHAVNYLSDGNVMKGITELAGALREGWLYPLDWQQFDSRGSSRYGFEASLTSLISNVGFIAVSRAPELTIYGNVYDSLGIEWDICPFPAFPAHTVFTGTGGVAVSKQTENPEAAAAFALFFLTPEGQRAFYSQSFKTVPSLRSLAGEEFWRSGTDWSAKNTGALVLYADNTVPASVFPRIPVSSSLFSADDFMIAVVKISYEDSKPENIISALQRETNQRIHKDWN